MPFLDPRVARVLDHAFDNDVAGAQVAILRCLHSTFAATQWWQAMLADEPQVAELLHQINLRMLH